jgi:hypothetical protein
MNDWLKNPFVVLLAGLLSLWLVFKVLRIVVNGFWVIAVAFFVLFLFNERFRRALRAFFYPPLSLTYSF